MAFVDSADDPLMQAIESLNPNMVRIDEDPAMAAQVTLLPDEIQAAVPAMPGPDEGHDENLAVYLEPGERAEIADKLLDYIDTDRRSRAPWDRFIERALKMLGVVEDSEDGKDSEPFRGASTVVMPLIAEAQTVFQAHAIAELFPPGGPAKGVIPGDDTNEEKEASRDRVVDYLNFTMTVEDEGYFPDHDQMLYDLPWSGSQFKHTYPDPFTGATIGRSVGPDKLIVPYGAKSLEDAPRYALEKDVHPDDVRRFKAVEHWLDVDLPEPGEPDQADSQPSRDEADLQERSIHEDDYPRRVYEVHIDFDLPGFDEDVPLPYIIEIDEEAREVLRVVRNWKQTDPHRKKRLWFKHYKYLPGTGFYGFGLPHAIGHLNEAATGALRLLLDSGAFASMNGGFRAKDASIKGGDLTVEPGVWKDLDASAEDLQKAFFSPPFKGPDASIFQLLGFLTDAGRRFTNTTEAMVGDGSNQGPVGTTVALIEQGMKTFSAIHKRLHFAQGQELKFRAELIAESIQDRYPYDVEGDEREVWAADFGNGIQIVPVSDPNIFSSTQRVAIAQGVLELANSAPDLYDRREAHEYMLTAMKVPDPDRFLQPVDQPPPARDPMTENMVALNGGAIRAIPQQNHPAHLAVHRAFLEHLATQVQNPMVAQASEQAIMAMVAHIQEHMAYDYGQEMIERMGVDLRLPDLSAGPEGEEQLPPEIESQVSVAAAIASRDLAAEIAEKMGEPPVDPEQQAKAAEIEAEIQRKDETADADIARKDEIAAADIARRDAETVAELAREARESEAKLARERRESEADVARRDREARANRERAQKQSKEKDKA